MIRLFVRDPLRQGQVLTPSQDQSHYLKHVMRLQENASLLVFNGQDGEWEARLQTLDKSGRKPQLQLILNQQLRPQPPKSRTSLMLGLAKRVTVETVVTKATELGIGSVAIVTTQRTNHDRLNLQRLQTLAIEAAEQCGRLEIPEIHPPQRLNAVLKDWPESRRLIFCDEAGEVSAVSALDLIDQTYGDDATILIGPEGGFSPEERQDLYRQKAVVPVRLGPNILRVDTAAILILGLWQLIQQNALNRASLLPDQMEL